jgi:hypothetical protein
VTPSTTTTNGQATVNAAATLSTLSVTFSGSAGVGHSWTVTVMVNGVASSLTCNTGTGATCTDSTHSVALAVGDKVNVQFVSSAAPNKSAAYTSTYATGRAIA